MTDYESTRFKQAVKPKIIELAEKVPDPQSDRFKRYLLISMIFIALVGTVCGADDWVAITDVGEHLEDWIKQHVELPFGIPSHDIFGRTFGIINNQAFSQLLIDWADHIKLKSKNKIVAMDSKTLRGNDQKKVGLTELYILNAWSVENSICLGHIDVDKKSNEITAIPKLIEILT